MNLYKGWKPETLEEALLYQTITSWDEDKLVLNNGTVLTIEMTQSDCCAWAGGEFSNVELDAVITNVVFGEEEEWRDSDTYGTTLQVVLYHNQNPIAQADLEADAGNGGYYYSVASFVVTNIDGERTELEGVSS